MRNAIHALSVQGKNLIPYITVLLLYYNNGVICSPNERGFFVSAIRFIVAGIGGNILRRPTGLTYDPGSGYNDSLASKSISKPITSL